MINLFPMTRFVPRWLWRTPAGIVLSISITAVAAYIVWILTGQYDPSVEELVSSIELVWLSFAAFTLGMYLASSKVYDPRLRRGWFFLALAFLSNGIGEGLWGLFTVVLHIEPFPSAADIFFLLYYPFILIGVLSFPFVPIRRRERIVLWLDLAIVLIASIMVFWYFIVSPSLPGETGLSWVLAIAYPVGDLLTLTGVLILIERDTDKIFRWTLVCLAAGILATTIADTTFAILDVQGISYPLPPLTIFWLVSDLLFLAGAVAQIISASHPIPPSPYSLARRLIRLLLPYVAAAIGPTLLLTTITPTLLSLDRFRELLLGTIVLMVLVLLRQYAVLLENVQLYSEMQHLAITDSLTGIYNRHFFNETFRREVERAHRYGKPMSVLLMDVNNFKMFNDTFGHLQGDRVLKLISEKLTSQLRRSDILARYGGDEFIVILPETDSNGARSVADKMSKSVSSQTYANLPLSVSIGVATYHPEITPEQMLEEADQELYRLKAVQTTRYPIL